MAFFEHDGCRFYYEEHGQGEALLLVHGLGSSTRDWEYQIPHLARTHRVLSLDLRGDKGAGLVQADTRQLARAIGNLLDNAITATPERGRILVALSRHKKGARVVISDNGPGMKPSELARALDGMRISPQGTADARRSGLGLPLARQLIEAHGGRLELQSEPGVGTTATIWLP